MEALKIDWSANDYLNFADLNRIEEWSKALHDRLFGYGYSTHFEQGKAWLDTDIPSVSDIDRIRTNITNLRNGYFSIPEWRELILGQFHDFNQQNAMEWDLQTCYNWIERMIQIFIPSGVYKSGNVYYLTDEMHFWPIIPYPVLVGEYTYNGKPQIPALTNDSNIERSGDTAPTDAGDYKLIVRPKHGFKWETGVRTSRPYSWHIKKATGVIDAVADYTMGRDNFNARIPFSYNGDGAISISCDPLYLTVIKTGKDFVNVVSQKVGETEIVISAAEGRNYTSAVARIRINIVKIARSAPASGSVESGNEFYIVNN